MELGSDQRGLEHWLCSCLHAVPLSLQSEGILKCHKGDGSIRHHGQLSCNGRPGYRGFGHL
jgi:hypothetical protein